MKLLIVGSRSITDLDISEYIPNDVDLIISGGASGIDTIAEQFADNHSIEKTIIQPQYNLYRKGAPLKRNEQMVKICDCVLAFWDGKSRGTMHTVEYAKKLNKPATVITITK